MAEALTVLFFTWIAMGALTAWLVDFFKKLIPWVDYQRKVMVSGKEKIIYAEHYAALLIAGVLSWSVALDFFDLLGINSKYAPLGWLLSCFIVSQGSHGLHDVWQRIKEPFYKFLKEFGSSYLWQTARNDDNENDDS